MADMGNYTAEINDFSKNATAGVEFIGQLILLLAERSNVVKDDDMMDMVTHLKNGGKCKTVTVPVKDMEHFTNLMKHYGVSYVPVQVPDPKTGEEMAIIAFRDTDQKAVKTVIDDYNRYCDGLVHELDYATFMDANRDKGFFKVDGLSKDELVVFRDEATKYNMDFMVTDSPTKPGAYMIYANNKTFLNRAVNDTLFSISGVAGKKYMQEMAGYGTKQTAILLALQDKAHGKEPYYIVDAGNPAQIISMKDNKYTSHQCRVVEEEQPDGTITHTPTDARYEERGAVGEDMLNELRRMKHPVLLSQAEMQEMVAGVGEKGELQLTAAFADSEKMSAWKTSISERDALDVKAPKREQTKIIEPGKMVCYSNLPTKAVATLSQAQIEGLVFADHSVAYPPDVDKQVQEVLDRELYAGLSPLARMQRDLECRGYGQGRFQYLAPEEEYYLVDSAHPGATMLRFDHEGVSGYVSDGKEGVQYIHKDANAPDYEQCVLSFISTTTVPVVVSKDDLMGNIFDDAGRINIEDAQARIDIAIQAQAYVPTPANNAAIQQALEKEEAQRDALNAYTEGKGELTNPSEAQREVLQRREEMQVEYEEPRQQDIDVEMVKKKKEERHHHQHEKEEKQKEEEPER